MMGADTGRRKTDGRRGGMGEAKCDAVTYVFVRGRDRDLDVDSLRTSVRNERTHIESVLCLDTYQDGCSLSPVSLTGRSDICLRGKQRIGDIYFLLLISSGMLGHSTRALMRRGAVSSRQLLLRNRAIVMRLVFSGWRDTSRVCSA